MKRFRNWLINRLLPTWARQEREAEIAKLRKEIEQLRAKADRLNAYIDGLEAGVKAQRRIIINMGGEGKP